jgi:hypothetical protein
MTEKPQGKKASRSGSRGSSKTTTWVLLAFSAIILVAIAFFIWQRFSNNVEFVLATGDEDILVLLRDEEQGEYTVQYNGSKPIELENLLVMLAPETLHVSVTEVVLVKGDEEVVLEKSNKVPDGTQFTLQPGDIFDVRVTFLGRTIGGNWLYGFRMIYDDGGGSETTELVLGFEYAIVVR